MPDRRSQHVPGSADQAAVPTHLHSHVGPFAGLTFTGRGARELKGLPGRWDLRRAPHDRYGIRARARADLTGGRATGAERGAGPLLPDYVRVSSCALTRLAGVPVRPRLV